MTDSKSQTSKSITLPTPSSKKSLMRKYDLLDMLTVTLYNGIVFAGGLGLGWFLWNRQ